MKLMQNLNPTKLDLSKPYDSTTGVPEWLSATFFILVVGILITIYVFLYINRRREQKKAQQILKRLNLLHPPQ